MKKLSIICTILVLVCVFLIGTAEGFWVWTPKTGKWFNPKFAVKDSPKEQFDWAMEFLKNKEYKRARKEFQKLIKYFPRAKIAADAQYYIGECYVAMDYLYHGFAAYQKVIDIYPYSKRMDTILAKQFEIGQRYLEGEKYKTLGVALLPAYSTGDIHYIISTLQLVYLNYYYYGKFLALKGYTQWAEYAFTASAQWLAHSREFEQALYQDPSKRTESLLDNMCFHAFIQLEQSINLGLDCTQQLQETAQHIAHELQQKSSSSLHYKHAEYVYKIIQLYLSTTTTIKKDAILAQLADFPKFSQEEVDEDSFFLFTCSSLIGQRLRYCTYHDLAVTYFSKAHTYCMHTCKHEQELLETLDVQKKHNFPSDAQTKLLLTQEYLKLNDIPNAKKMFIQALHVSDSTSARFIPRPSDFSTKKHASHKKKKTNHKKQQEETHEISYMDSLSEKVYALLKPHLTPEELSLIEQSFTPIPQALLPEHGKTTFFPTNLFVSIPSVIELFQKQRIGSRNLRFIADNEHLGIGATDVHLKIFQNYYTQNLDDALKTPSPVLSLETQEFLDSDTPPDQVDKETLLNYIYALAQHAKQCMYAYKIYIAINDQIQADHYLRESIGHIQCMIYTLAQCGYFTAPANHPTLSISQQLALNIQHKKSLLFTFPNTLESLPHNLDILDVLFEYSVSCRKHMDTKNKLLLLCKQLLDIIRSIPEAELDNTQKLEILYRQIIYDIESNSIPHALEKISTVLESPLPFFTHPHLCIGILFCLRDIFEILDFQLKTASSDQESNLSSQQKTTNQLIKKITHMFIETENQLTPDKISKIHVLLLNNFIRFLSDVEEFDNAIHLYKKFQTLVDTLPAEKNNFSHLVHMPKILFLILYPQKTFPFLSEIKQMKEKNKPIDPQIRKDIESNFAILQDFIDTIESQNIQFADPEIHANFVFGRATYYRCKLLAQEIFDEPIDKKLYEKIINSFLSHMQLSEKAMVFCLSTLALCYEKLGLPILGACVHMRTLENPNIGELLHAFNQVFQFFMQCPISDIQKTQHIAHEINYLQNQKSQAQEQAKEFPVETHKQLIMSRYNNILQDAYELALHYLPIEQYPLFIQHISQDKNACNDNLLLQGLCNNYAPHKISTHTREKLILLGLELCKNLTTAHIGEQIIYSYYEAEVFSHDTNLSFLTHALDLCTHKQVSKYGERIVAQYFAQHSISSSLLDYIADHAISLCREEETIESGMHLLIQYAPTSDISDAHRSQVVRQALDLCDQGNTRRFGIQLLELYYNAQHITPSLLDHTMERACTMCQHKTTRGIAETLFIRSPVGEILMTLIEHQEKLTSLLKDLNGKKTKGPKSKKKVSKSQDPASFGKAKIVEIAEYIKEITTSSADFVLRNPVVEQQYRALVLAILENTQIPTLARTYPHWKELYHTAQETVPILIQINPEHESTLQHHAPESSASKPEAAALIPAAKTPKPPAHSNHTRAEKPSGPGSVSKPKPAPTPSSTQTFDITSVLKPGKKKKAKKPTPPRPVPVSRPPADAKSPDTTALSHAVDTARELKRMYFALQHTPLEIHTLLTEKGEESAKQILAQQHHDNLFALHSQYPDIPEQKFRDIIIEENYSDLEEFQQLCSEKQEQYAEEKQRAAQRAQTLENLSTWYQGLKNLQMYIGPYEKDTSKNLDELHAQLRKLALTHIQKTTPLVESSQIESLFEAASCFQDACTQAHKAHEQILTRIHQDFPDLTQEDFDRIFEHTCEEPKVSEDLLRNELAHATEELNKIRAFFQEINQLQEKYTGWISQKEFDAILNDLQVPEQHTVFDSSVLPDLELVQQRFTQEREHAQVKTMLMLLEEYENSLGEQTIKFIMEYALNAEDAEHTCRTLSLMFYCFQHTQDPWQGFCESLAQNTPLLEALSQFEQDIIETEAHTLHKSFYAIPNALQRIQERVENSYNAHLSYQERNQNLDDLHSEHLAQLTLRIQEKWNPILTLEHQKIISQHIENASIEDLPELHIALHRIALGILYTEQAFPFHIIGPQGQEVLLSSIDNIAAATPDIMDISQIMRILHLKPIKAIEYIITHHPEYYPLFDSESVFYRKPQMQKELKTLYPQWTSPEQLYTWLGRNALDALESQGFTFIEYTPTQNQTPTSLNEQLEFFTNLLELIDGMLEEEQVVNFHELQQKINQSSHQEEKENVFETIKVLSYMAGISLEEYMDSIPEFLMDLIILIKGAFITGRITTYCVKTNDIQPTYSGMDEYRLVFNTENASPVVDTEIAEQRKIASTLDSAQ